MSALLVRDGDALVAEAAPARVDVDVPASPSYEEAVRASAQLPGLRGARLPDAASSAGRSASRATGCASSRGRWATVASRAPWTPTEVTPELVWAALDCPGAIAVGFPDAARPSSAGSRLRSTSSRGPASAASWWAGRSARRAGSSTPGRRCSARTGGSSRPPARPGSSRYRCSRIAFRSFSLNLVRAGDQVVDVVVLGVDVAARERVGSPGRELATSFGASSGGVHGASSPKPLGHLRPHEPRADEEDGDPCRAARSASVSP